MAIWVRFGFQLDSLEKNLITLTVFTRSRSYRESEHEPAFSNLPFWKFVHSRGNYLYPRVIISSSIQINYQHSNAAISIRLLETNIYQMLVTNSYQHSNADN